MYCLKVEAGIVGIASEYNGAAFLKGEILLDNILYGDIVCTVVHPIRSEHIETAFIEPRSPQHTIAPHVDIVVGATVHQQAQGGIRRTVHEEVDA